MGELVDGPDLIASHARNLGARLGAATIASDNLLVIQHLNSLLTDLREEALLCRGAVSLEWQLSITQHTGDAVAG